MVGRRQFSLRFLFWETLLVAAALGLFRAATALPPEYEVAALALMIASMCAAGAAIGGFSGNWFEGAFIIFLLAVLSSLFLPAVMVA